MNRRGLLIGAGGLALIGAAGCDGPRKYLDPRAESSPGSSPTLPSAETRLLERAAFGVSATDAARLKSVGQRAWLDEQLSAPLGKSEDEGETFGLNFQTRRLESLRENSYELRDQGEKHVLMQLQQASILRACYSKWQLRERMADFWTNHFNIYEHKVYTPQTREKSASELAFLLGQDQREVVRKHALGNFKDILWASMQSPAMLGYLDNQLSDARHPNENYARELMELHTLGAQGGYSQKDVMEVARCLTGWGVEDRFLRANGQIRWEATRHDDGAKSVLGVTILPGGGQSDAERVRDLLVAHPSTGRFLARKLVRYFYGDDQEAPRLRALVADSYARTHGDIKSMMRALFTAPEFASAPPTIKRPIDFLASSIRATGALTDGGGNLQDHLTKMGQLAFSWPMPDGYPDRTSAWTGSLLPRFNFALALASGGIGGTKIDSHDAALALLPKIAHVGETWERIALGLSAPEFQWR